MRTPSDAQGLQPHEIVAEMQAAGAIFSLQPNEARTNWRYHVAIAPDGDGPRCRSLLGQVDVDPDTVSDFRCAVFVAILRAAWNMPVGEQ